MIEPFSKTFKYSVVFYWNLYVVRNYLIHPYFEYLTTVPNKMDNYMRFMLLMAWTKLTNLLVI